MIPFVLTYLVGMKKLSREERGLTSGRHCRNLPRRQRQGEGELKAFLSGKVIPLEEVPDDVFSQHVMGDGLAIEPTDTLVKAPAPGKVSAVMEDSRHACGLAFENGMEVLIHVGIDTVV